MNDTRPRCYVCGELDGPEDRELKPYGIHGQPICFGCMTNDPAREAEGMRQIHAELARMPHPAPTSAAPRPLSRVERRRLERQGIAPARTGAKEQRTLHVLRSHYGEAKGAKVIPIERARVSRDERETLQRTELLKEEGEDPSSS